MLQNIIYNNLILFQSVGDWNAWHELGKGQPSAKLACVLGTSKNADEPFK